MCEVDWKILLEYLKVLLSWPPLAALMLAIFFGVFRPEIRTFLQNVRPKVPGTDQLPTLQPVDRLSPPEPEGPLEPEVPPEPEPDVGGAAMEPAGSTAPEPTQDPANDRLVQALVAQRTTQEHYRYLNNLLVLATQVLLDELVGREFLTVGEYNSTWSSLPPANRSNMLAILYQQGLATVENDKIRITDRGYAYAMSEDRNSWVNAQKAIWSAESNRNALAARLAERLAPPINLFEARNVTSEVPSPGNIFATTERDQAMRDARRARRQTATRTSSNLFAKPPAKPPSDEPS